MAGPKVSGASVARAARMAAEAARKAEEEGAPKGAHQASGDPKNLGLVSINRFDLDLWRKFVGLAKMKGLSIPEATAEAFRMWIRHNIKELQNL